MSVEAKNSVSSFLSCSSSGPDTLIIVLIETKMSNRSQGFNNRFVSFYGHGLLFISGLRKPAGSRSARTVILKRDRGQRWNVGKWDRLGFDVYIFKSFKTVSPFSMKHKQLCSYRQSSVFSAYQHSLSSCLASCKWLIFQPLMVKVSPVCSGRAWLHSVPECVYVYLKCICVRVHVGFVY